MGLLCGARRGSDGPDRGRAANAAVAAPAAHSAVTHNPWGPGPHCSWWDRERWNVNGHNTVKLVYSSTNYTYTVDFKQNGSCLGGTLTDRDCPRARGSCRFPGR